MIMLFFSYSEVLIPEYFQPHIQPVAFLGRPHSFLSLVTKDIGGGVQLRQTEYLSKHPLPIHFCLKVACKKG